MDQQDTYQFDQPEQTKFGTEMYASINDPGEVEGAMEAVEEQEEEKKPKPGFFKRIQKYPFSFLFAIGLQYFNNGMNTIITLAYLDVFRQIYNLQPAVTSQYSAIMVLPWSPKILYGFFTDTFPIFGSRKRSYLIIMGLVQGITLIVVFFPIENVVFFVSMLTLKALSGAVMDVVVDGLMVVQSRNDPETGSEDLQTFCWAMVGVGGVVGSLAGGYLTQYGATRWCFAICALLGFLIALSGFLMPKSAEQEIEELVGQSLGERTKQNARNVWQGVKLPQLYRSIIFFIILGFLIPNFSDFLYYYQLDVSGFTQVQYSWLQVISYIALFLSMFIYSGLLKESPIRTMMIVACFINMVGAVTTVLYTLKITFGLSPLAFVVMTTTVTDTLYNAYTTLPGMVLFAKLIPESVESSMFALLTGLTNLSNLFLSKELGIFINSFVGVNETNLDRIWELYAIQAGCCFVPMFFVWLLPNRQEVKLVQEMLAAQIETRLTETGAGTSKLIEETDEDQMTYRNNNINKDTTDAASTVYGDNQTSDGTSNF